jgi:hypothetical protein|tara:strand:+ start:567 stop:1484 length:918 start_codon:yes stop_codon:yes gene_type:complete
MNTYTPQLYSIDDDNAWKTYLDNYGFVVIKDILNVGIYSDLFTQFYLDWSHVTPNFNFHDVNTWKPENSPMMWDIGMITGYGLGHAKFQWGLRTNENILNIWKKLHNTNDLVVSYDGFSVFFSPEQQSGTWLHVDQNPKDTLYSVQGAYNFLSVDEDDAGFVVVPGSHKTFYVDLDESHKFIPVDPEDVHVDYAVKLLIPANCFVLWNSKTLHANVGMSRTKEVELNRVTSYICYFPREQRPENILQKRISAYHNVINCGHYAIDYNPKRNVYNDINNIESQIFSVIKPIYDNNGQIPEDIVQLI